MTQMIWTFYEEVKSIFNFIYKNNIIIYTYAINIPVLAKISQYQFTKTANIFQLNTLA